MNSIQMLKLELELARAAAEVAERERQDTHLAHVEADARSRDANTIVQDYEDALETLEGRLALAWSNRCYEERARASESQETP